jgi:hypothetical protein
MDGMHRFAAVAGPSGHRCEEHKDHPVTIDGRTYGEQQRR